jgi:hypothetical protein
LFAVAHIASLPAIVNVICGSGFNIPKHLWDKARNRVMTRNLLKTTLALKTAVVTLLACLLARTAFAAGPIETSVFAVQGVAVDVTDVDVAAAKNKALVEVQMKAFMQLADKLGNQSLADSVAKYPPDKVMPFLRSLSIEEEVTSPGRYQGKFTVRFLPAKIRSLYGSFGVDVPDLQAPAILVIPVWVQNGKPEIFTTNPWAEAWQKLRAEQADVPVIVPLADSEDRELLSAADAAAKDPIKLERIRRRYDVKTVLVAVAEAAPEGGVRAVMEGATALGKVKFDKVYQDEAGTIPGSADVAVKRFHDVMAGKYKSDRAKVVEARATEERAKAAGPRSIAVLVSFSSPSQWTGLRSRILSTPGVIGVDIASLDGNGATISMRFSGGVEDMQTSMQASGLRLARGSGGWVIEDM